MKRKIFFCAAITLLSAGIIIGCAPPKPAAVITRSEATDNFLRVCKDNYGLSPLIKIFERTLWIYLPVEEDILVLKATPEGPQKSNQAKETQTLNFLDGRFENGSFNLEYDISKKKSYETGYGYTNAYTESVTTKQNNILTALYQTFMGIETIPGDVEYADPQKQSTHQYLVKSYVPTDRTPEFVVLLVADVHRGIEMKSLFYFKDFMRVMTGELPQEEYQRRNPGELYGHEIITGDKEGKHVNFRDLNMPEFLTEQILNRIRLKYQSSDHPPGDDTENEIITMVAQVMKYYSYADFTSVKLSNLYRQQAFTFSKDQVPSFFQE